MNLPNLKTELLNVLTSTTNLTATEKQKLRNRCVLLHQSEFNQYLIANSLNDTATTRGQFFIEKTVGNPPAAGLPGYWSDIYMSGSRRENENTMPATETF